MKRGSNGLPARFVYIAKSEVVAFTGAADSASLSGLSPPLTDSSLLPKLYENTTEADCLVPYRLESEYP